MKKVTFLLKNYFTHDSRVLKEGKTLVKAGYDVRIYCLWDGKLPRKEVKDGIKIERIQYHVSKPRAEINKIILFLKIPVLMNYLMILCFALKSLFKGKCDIVHCHDLDPLPVGFLMKKIYGSDIVYDAHEYETECDGLSAKAKRARQIIERLFIPYADVVITVSDSIANEYSRLYNIKKPYLVLNCPPYKEKNKFNHLREDLNIKDDQMIFLHQGVLSPGRGIERTIEAFLSLSGKDKVIVFMGGGSLEGMIKDASSRSDIIFYHDAVPMDILFEYTSSADVGTMLIDNVSLSYYYCAPNKFFEYTMSVLPVIVSDLFEVGNIINKYKNGIIVKSEENLADVVQKITWNDILTLGSSDLPLVYNWENQEKVLLEIYAALPCQNTTNA